MLLMQSAAFPAAFLAAIAILFGGGGSPAPIAELVVQLTALAALGLWWFRGAQQGRLDETGSGSALWIVGLILAVPLVQLVPLPPAIWQSFPGRETLQEALALVGQENTWRPISISPVSTLASLFALIPPAIMLFLVARLDAPSRHKVVHVVAALALASALFGALQLAGGKEALRFYAASHSGVITGFHANRNAAADILLIGLMAVTLIAAKGRRGLRQQLPVWWAVPAAIVILLAIVFTASRTGIALVAVALAIAWWIIAPKLEGRSRRLWPLAIGAALMVPVAGSLFHTNAAFRAVADRFALTQDPRPELWADTFFAMQSYWPLGSGLGTFWEAFVPAERLEAVDESLPNRAHFDYLEFLLEAGVLGMVVLVLIAAMIVRLAITSLRNSGPGRDLAKLGIGILLVLALHSVVDYPLRSMSLACLAAMGVGLLTTPPRSRPEQGSGGNKRNAANKGRSQ